LETENVTLNYKIGNAWSFVPNERAEMKHNPKTASVGLDLATTASIGKLNTTWKIPRQNVYGRTNFNISIQNGNSNKTIGLS
jgi:hypothetical protein